MITALAHLTLFGRHHTTVTVFGYHFTYCHHRSHILGLRCWRFMFWEGRCIRHANSCPDLCPEDPHPDFYDTDHESDF